MTTSIQSQWKKLSQQQSTTFEDANSQLEQLTRAIHAMQDTLTRESPSDVPASSNDDGVPLSASIDLRVQLTNLTKFTTETKTKLTKDFKNLYTNITKLSGKMEKTFTSDLDDFCPAELFASTGYRRTHSIGPIGESGSQSQQSGPPVTPVSSSPLLPYAAITPVPPPSTMNPSTPSAPPASVASIPSSREYNGWLDSIMMDTWLRDGRTELVDALREESQAFTSIPDPISTLHDAQEFQTMHHMVKALKRRDMEPCLKWLIEEKSRVQTQIHDAEHALAQAKEQSDSATSSSSTNATGSPLSPIRKRVSFSEEAKDAHTNEMQGEVTNETNGTAARSSNGGDSSPASAASVSALSSVLSSLQSHYSSLHNLQFDCHRMKFLQLLIDSEDATRKAKGQRKQRKRKLRSSGMGEAEDASFSSDGAPADVDMLSEESQALAADETSSDEELNAIAAGRTGPNPSSVSHHDALKYAQTFFPVFAATRMDDIRKLSGSLLFLGHLTSHASASNHPYSSYFSKEGNTSMWCSLMRRAKSLCLTRMKKPNRNPMIVTLEACDIALPQLLKFQSVLRMNQEMLSASNGSIAHPEIELGSQFQFHSTFICPVSKEQCTTTATEEEMQEIIGTNASSGGLSSPITLSNPFGVNPLLGSDQQLLVLPAAHSNPPVMLRCGHCISYLAMDKIVRGLRMTRRFKCPTCPREQTPQEVLTLHL